MKKIKEKSIEGITAIIVVLMILTVLKERVETSNRNNNINKYCKEEYGEKYWRSKSEGKDICINKKGEKKYINPNSI